MPHVASEPNKLLLEESGGHTSWGTEFPGSLLGLLLLLHQMFAAGAAISTSPSFREEFW